MIAQLIWKESREHWGKMAVLLGLLLVPMMAIQKHLVNAEMETMVGMALLASWIASIWIAAWTTTAEASARTTGTLAALPVRSGTVFAIKTAWGAATVLLPVGAVLALVFCLVPSLSEADQPVLFSWSTLICSLNLYLLMVAVTQGIRREGLAAMVGLLVLLACGLGGALMTFIGPKSPVYWRWLMVPNPFAAFLALDKVPAAQVLLLAHCAMALVWWALGAWRFSSHAKGKRLGQATPVAKRSPTPVGPARFPLGPMVWREYREQRGVVLGAGMAALGMAFLTASFMEYRQSPESPHWIGLLECVAVDFLVLLGAFIGMVVPCIAALILGVSALATDMEPRLMGFWRSRPLRPAAFFWTKYAVALSGVVLLLTVLAGAAMLALYLLFPNEGVTPDTYALQSHEWRTLLRPLLGEAFTLPLVLSMSMFFGIVSRRTIYAVALSVMLTLAWLNIPVGQFNDSGRVLFEGPIDLPFAFFTILTVIATVTLTILARVALERNWRVG